MELTDQINANDAEPIIESVSALFFVCYYIWLRVSSRMKRNKSKATGKAIRRSCVVSGSVQSRQLASVHCKYQEFNQLSNKELLLLIVDLRERLANIEGRLGASTPRMSAVLPPLETSAEEPSAQS